MRQYQGLQIEIKPTASGEALKEYKNDHMIPADDLSNLTCPRLVREAPGTPVEIVLTVEYGFPMYTADALLVDITFNSGDGVNAVSSQCYVIPLDNKHRGFQVHFKTWVKWDHSKTGSDSVVADYTMPARRGIEAAVKSTQDWTRDYGCADEGCIVVNIIRGKLPRYPRVTEGELRSTFKPPTAPT